MYNQHLLNISDLKIEDIHTLLSCAEQKFQAGLHKRHCDRFPLRPFTQINLFFENSTRTSASFELAGKRLGADVLTLSIATSSINKGETLLDTVCTLDHMSPDILVVRHPDNGAIEQIAQNVRCHVINAGDGTNEHPTQALLDALTITIHKQKIAGLTIAICGDLLHSRVARSNILCLSRLGAKIHIIAPEPLRPQNLPDLNLEYFSSLDEGLKNVDVIMMLRIQNERMKDNKIQSLDDYIHNFCLTENRLQLAKEDCIVMHPGPMNRGVEIESNVADGPQSVIRQQVEMGVAMRMTIMEHLYRHDYEKFLQQENSAI